MSSVQNAKSQQTGWGRFGKAASLLAVVTAGLMLFTACGHRHHFKDRSERMVKKMDRIADHLELKGDQQSQYQDLRQRVLADLKAGHSSRMEGLREIKAEFQKTEPDVDTLSKQIADRMNNGHERFVKAPAYVAEFYAILDKEQKAEVKEFVLDKLEKL